MAIPCSQCLWYLPDEAKACPYCGAKVSKQSQTVIRDQESPWQSIIQYLQRGLSLLVLGLFGFVLYHRALPEASVIAISIADASRCVFTWLVGSQGQYADYLALAIAVSVVVWLILWLMNRFESYL